MTCCLSLFKSFIALGMIPDSIRELVKVSFSLGHSPGVSKANKRGICAIALLHGFVIVLSVSTTPEGEILITISELIGADRRSLDLTELRRLTHLSVKSLKPVCTASHYLVAV